MKEETGSAEDMMSQWLKWQHNFWESWMETANKGTEANKAVWSSQIPTQMMSGWYETWVKPFLEPVHTNGKNGKNEEFGEQVFDRISTASKAYLDLVGLWGKSASLLSQIPPGTVLTTEKSKEIYDQWIKDYEATMARLWGGHPSKDIAETAEAYEHAGAASAEYGWRYLEPVLKNLEGLPDILARLASGETGATAELSALLHKNYEATLGKLLNAPSIGYFKEPAERLGRTVDSYVQFNVALAEYFVPFYQTGLLAGEKVFQRLTEFQGQEMTPEAMRDLYQIWWAINEDVYHELFQSEEFTRLLGEVMRQGLLFRKNLDELTGKLAQMANLPSKQDMDEIYHAIYDLKKEVRWQRRALRELQDRAALRVVRPSPTE